MVVQEESAIRAAALEVIGSVKSSQEPLDEMLKIATKYAASLRQTLALSHSFLESLQVVAEGAERAKGQTPRIGFSLKELINVQKKIEEKRHLYSLALVNDFITPLKEKAAHDAKTVSKMEKDYEKLTKKSKETMKKATVKSVKMTKQVQKGKEDQSSLDAAMKKVNLAVKQFDDEQRKTVSVFMLCYDI